LTIRVNSQLYDITTHVATIVISTGDAYARFGHQVEESYRTRHRVLCENHFANGNLGCFRFEPLLGAGRIVATE